MLTAKNMIKLTMKLKWELLFYQDLVSFWFWHRVRMRLKALISQRFDLISSHKKNFHLILQEKALILILFHLISWKIDLISFWSHEKSVSSHEDVISFCFISFWSHEHVISFWFYKHVDLISSQSHFSLKSE